VSTDVTRRGLAGERPGREATTGVNAGRPRERRGGGREVMVPEATPTSYYGQPVLHRPTWEARDIAGYFFLGGLAGAGSVVGAAAQLTGRPGLARVAKVGAAGAAGLSIGALVHDLGRPARFVNMLRVWKPSSPMSVGSWILAGYVPAAGAAALADLTGRWPRAGGLATAAAALAGPAVATYTGALVADTAVPAWHDGHREMPLVFGASGTAGAAGLGLLTAPAAETAPVRRLAVAAAGAELVLARRLRQGMHPAVAASYHAGRAGRLLRAAESLTAAGAVLAAAGRRRPWLARIGGAALLAGSACTRFGIFQAGIQSVDDPDATVLPQRDRRR
jgi:hypothetical protein